MFVFNKETKQNNTTAKKRKKSHPAGVEPETFDVERELIIYCTTQPLLKTGCQI